MLYHHQRASLLQCLACMEYIAIPRRDQTDPETLVLFKEEQEIEHKPCELYTDVHMAKMAREQRKRDLKRAARNRRRGINPSNPWGNFVRAQ